MLTIDRPIIVEGKYDKMKLKTLFNAVIITTDGFGIFNKKERLAMIRRLAEERGVIILTDSDGAGVQIRSYLSSAIDKDKIIHLYIPQIKGKERRKTSASSAGMLGVEGIDAARLYELLLPFSCENSALHTQGAVTKADLYADGLCGGDSATAKRDKFASLLHLPSGMSANALLAAVNVLLSGEQYRDIINKIEGYTSKR